MAGNLAKQSFNSGNRYERIVLKSSAPFSVAGGGFANTTVTIPHNLGYKPYVKSWYTFGGKVFDLFAGPASFNLDGNSAQISNANVTTSSYIIFIENFGGAVINGTIEYRIYAEPQV